MKKIYIVLSQTGTILSRIIKFYTKQMYNHVSIALDENLEQLYSFGRLNPYNAFIGGFVKEGINIGTFARFSKTVAEVYSLEVTDYEYENIKKEIKNFEDNRQKYKFNIAGMFLVSINKKIERKNCFYCAEFVKHILKQAGIDVRILPELIKPGDFSMIPELNLEYSGYLKYFRLQKISEMQIGKLLKQNVLN